MWQSEPETTEIQEKKKQSENKSNAINFIMWSDLQREGLRPL